MNSNFPHANMAKNLIFLIVIVTMFIATYYGYFLHGGLASVLNFHIALIASVLDVLSKPMQCGVSMEMGLKFPTSYAYFPKKHCAFLYILTGPISCETFLDLVCHIGTDATPTSKYSNQQDSVASSGIFGHGAKGNAVNNNSTWFVQYI